MFCAIPKSTHWSLPSETVPGGFCLIWRPKEKHTYTGQELHPMTPNNNWSKCTEQPIKLTQPQWIYLQHNCFS